MVNWKWLIKACVFSIGPHQRKILKMGIDTDFHKLIQFTSS